MLQCPNCKEYCISYLDTFGAKFNSTEVCKKCGGLYSVSGFDVFKRILFPLLGLVLIMYFHFSFFPKTSGLFLILLCAIMFFLIDYLLYKTSSPLKNIKASNEELGIINVDKNEFKQLLDKLSFAKKNSFITILENEDYKRYLEIGIKNKKYILSLSLTTKENRDLENRFNTFCTKLGYNITKNSSSDFDFLEIILSEYSTDVVAESQIIFKNIFNVAQYERFIVIPELD